MKKLVLATLLCGSVAQLGGCIIVGDDDGSDPPPPPPPDAMEPPPPPVPSAIVFSWTLLGGELQSAVTCPPDAPDIVITADPLDNAAAPDEVFLYDCVDEVTLAEELDPGAYDVWIELLDADGNLYAQSDILEGVVLDPEELLELDFEFSIDRGKFALTWTVLENGVQSTCEDVGADDVSLLLTVANSTEGDDFIFSCSAGEGVTEPMPLEAYVGIVTLLDSGADPADPADDDVLGESEPRNLSLDYGNHFADLGNFTFDILD